MSFPSGTYYSVNQVGKKYNNEQTYWNLPAGDTWGESKDNDYCKQWFSGNKLMDLCVDLERGQSVYVKGNKDANDNDKNYVNYYFNVSNDPDAQNGIKNSRFKYNTTTNRNVWIVSHGQNNGYSDMYQTTDAIINQKPNDIVLSLDWGDCSRKERPTQTDQCIRPIAESIAYKLKIWGLPNANKLRMVGHSMGTFMVTEISKALNDREGLGNTSELTLSTSKNSGHIILFFHR
jgi:predicted phosphodiesterase